MTPAERYYAGLPPIDLGDIDAPPPLAGVTAESMIPHGPRAEPAGYDPSLTVDVREPTGFTREGPRPFSWNAPGYENAPPRPASSILAPKEEVRDLGEIDGPRPPSAPSFARGPAQPDTEPSKPSGTPESAAAAKALAYYGGAGKPAGGSKGGPGGAPSGPSEYARGVAGLRGTYDADKDATRAGAAAEKARAEAVAVGSAAVAQQKMDDEAIQKVEAANTAKNFSDYSAETQRQIDDVRAKKIDTNRAYADTGSRVAAVIGGVLGGMYMGLNHQTSNQFIEQMNKTIDRDIAAQESELRNKKEAIGERKGLLAEMRATYKDEALAKIQARNLYYEGAKEAIAAQAASYESPAIQARADQAISALSREQSKLDIQEAMRKAAAAAAAATAAEHRRQVDFENQLKLQHMQNETLTAGANAVKAVREGGKEHQAAVAHVGDKLAEVDKQGMATDLESLHKYLIDPKSGQVDKSRSIPGVGRMADLREAVAPPIGKGGALDVAGAAGPAGWVARGGSAAVLGLSPEERQNKNAYERTFLAFKNIKTGSASSEQEHARLVNAWEGAKTTEEVAAAVAQSHAFIQRNKDAIRAENPEATAEYEANLRAQTSRDRTNTVKREAPTK